MKKQGLLLLLTTYLAFQVSYPSLGKCQHIDQATLLYRSWDPYHGILRDKPIFIFTVTLN